MIKAEIIAESYGGIPDHPDSRDSVLVYRGKIPAVPREGDLLDIWDGFAGLMVKRVWFDIKNQMVSIVINPDHTGDIAQEVIDIFKRDPYDLNFNGEDSYLEEEKE